MKFTLRAATLLVCTMLIPFSAFSESDWFKIGNVRFSAKAASGWILQSTNDDARSEDGDCNLLYQRMGGDECNYGIIGVKVVNRNLPVAAPQKKKKPNKKAETFAEFRNAGDFTFFYFESSERAKKCRNKSYLSVYVYRINDTLDLNIFMTAITTPAEADRMKFDIRNLVDDFFQSNGEKINSLKPFADQFIRRDSMSVIGNTLIFPVLPGWEVKKTYEEDKDDPTGLRWAAVLAGSQSCPQPTFRIEIDEFGMEPGTDMLGTLILGSDKQKQGLRNSVIAYDSVLTTVKRQGYDTLTSGEMKSATACKKEVFVLSETFKVVYSDRKGNYAINFTMSSTINDPVELLYMREQLKYIGQYLVTENNFALWD